MHVIIIRKMKYNKIKTNMINYIIIKKNNIIYMDNNYLIIDKNKFNLDQSTLLNTYFNIKNKKNLDVMIFRILLLEKIHEH